MTPEVFQPVARQKVLFLSFIYPSGGGSGSQLRAASLIRVLARESDIYLMIAGYAEKLVGPADPVMECVCRKMVYLHSLRPPISESVAASPRAEVCRKIAGSRLAAEAGGALPPARISAAEVALLTVDCAHGQAADRVVEFYQENQLDSLFVFKFDALHFVYGRLDFFPVRHLDLDELPSRAQDQIARLRQSSEPGPPSPPPPGARATIRLVEKTLIPRFHRVFVASALEAEEVRRQTGFPRPLILPNVYPIRPVPPDRPSSPPFLILFVGSFFYYPNVDAVRYFCREILPLIQREKGAGVVFRIIGTGGTQALESVRRQAGVELAGYQENLAESYARAAVVVVPLRAGAGTRLKILEAFSHGRPVVSTSIGAEGLAVTHRQDILLADDPAAFARACLELMDHSDLAGRLCEAAGRLHRDRYSPEALERCYRQIDSAGPPGSPSVLA
jgi:glycosyltransferase involved in cell wall biosynthesis